MKLNQFRYLMNLLRHLGPRWVAFRVWHGWRRRSGFYERRSAARQWDEIPWLDWCGDEDLADPETYLQWRRGKAPPFLFSAGDFSGWRERLRQYDKEAEGDIPTGQANRIASGTFPHYSVHWLERGNSPDWRMNPFTGEVAETDAHWSKIADNGFGDIKHIWELSRFSWVFPLVRAFARDGKGTWAEHYWRLLEDWLDNNPPQQGVNWMCGQETAIRLMAWCFGLYAFIDTPATTPTRLRRLVLAVAQSARRIEVNLDYALQQKNNHGITECVGLITAGTLFPELERAERWLKIGQQHLQAQVAELFYTDGAFSQHSPNYARLALQALIWVHQLRRKNRFESDGWLYEAIGRASRFLFEICEPETGVVPNSGGNDGALLLPLNNCDYSDFRPVIQAGMAIGKDELPFASGPWDEDLDWLGADSKRLNRSSRSPSAAFDAQEGGVFTLRNGDWTAIARAPEFRHRPAHADSLHVDLCYQGNPVAIDPGSYSYRAGPPFQESFKTTRYHNTVEVDGLSQMEPVGRFMLLPWANSRLRRRGGKPEQGIHWMLLETDAYRRLRDPVRHQRLVLMKDSFLAVVDWLRAAKEHRYRLHWLFDGMFDHEIDGANGTVKGTLKTGSVDLRVEVSGLNAGLEGSVIKGDPDSARGWWSKRYMEKEAVPSVALMGSGTDLLFVSVFSVGKLEWSLNKESRKMGIGPVKLDFGPEGIRIG